MLVTSEDVPLEQVTVYVRGARVRRGSKMSLALPGRLRILNLPLAVVDDTVRVEVEGPAVAITVRAGVDARVAEPAPEDTPELREAKRRVALAQARVDQFRSTIERLAACSGIAEDPSDDPPAGWDAIVRARRSIVALRVERELAVREQLSAAARDVDAAQRALEVATDRDRRRGSAQPAKAHELRKFVDVELAPSSDAPSEAQVTVHLEYFVAAARWAPSYVARLDGDRVTVELRAVVAQETGEDWERVRLQLSTAEPTRFASLPELAEQRIGRRQSEPARAGFRAPPVGVDALYADYDRELARSRRGLDGTGDEVDAPPQPDATLFGRSVAPPDGQFAHADSRAHTTPVTTTGGVSMATPMPGAFAPAKPQPAIQQDRASDGAPELAKRFRREATGAAANSIAIGEPEPAAPPTTLLDYANLVMAQPSSHARGRLIVAGDRRRAIDPTVDDGCARVGALALPPGCVGDWTHTYDFAYATEGAVDVRSDGAWHAIAVTTKPSGATLHHVAVPREQPDVFRVAAIANPFPGALLPGPIDVYEHGRFLVTSAVDYTPPGAAVDLGLGVDAAVKIARNSEFREEATGMLRGALRLHHLIKIDIENVSGRSVELEVRERIPVTREGDDDIEVATEQVDPAWERWASDPGAPGERRLRGGYRWRLVVPAGQKRTLRAGYEIKIPGKSELVGGNRREP